MRGLASFIGLAINTFHAILQASLRYRELERDNIAGLRISRDFSKTVQLSDLSVSELHWWISNVEKKNGKPQT